MRGHDPSAVTPQPDCAAAVSRWATTLSSLPVTTSKTKPRTRSVCGMKALDLMRATDWRTSVSRSEKASAAQGGGCLPDRPDEDAPPRGRERQQGVRSVTTEGAGDPLRIDVLASVQMDDGPAGAESADDDTTGCCPHRHRLSPVRTAGGLVTSYRRHPAAIARRNARRAPRPRSTARPRSRPCPGCGPPPRCAAPGRPARRERSGSRTGRGRLRRPTSRRRPALRCSASSLPSTRRA